MQGGIYASCNDQYTRIQVPGTCRILSVMDRLVRVCPCAGDSAAAWPSYRLGCKSTRCDSDVSLRTFHVVHLVKRLVSRPCLRLHHLYWLLYNTRTHCFPTAPSHRIDRHCRWDSPLEWR